MEYNFFRMRNERLWEAGFSDRYGYDALYPEVHQSILDMYNFIRREFSHRHSLQTRFRGFVLSGGFGAGKSSFLALIADLLICNSYKAEYITTAELIDAKNGKQGDFTNKKVNSPILFIDDLGWIKKFENEINYVVAIIRDRYANGRPTFIASNLDLELLKEKKSQYTDQYKQLSSYFGDGNKYMQLALTTPDLRALNDGEIIKPDISKSVLKILDNHMRKKLNIAGSNENKDCAKTLFDKI